VIHAASADHPESIVTLVSALERSGKTLICTTGSGIAADSAAGEYAGSVAFSDDTYFEPVALHRPRVAMNRFVRQAAIDKGIRSMVICPSMVYGTGRGLQPDSDQLPKLMAVSKHLGAGVYFGKGLNRYSNVHIDDLVDLYVLVLAKAPGGSFFFAENGDASFREIAELISRALGFGGKTVSLSIEDLVRQYGDASRYGVTSNSLVRAVNARRLGWSPKAPSLIEYLTNFGSTQ
jgi:nucleoside-diphosphate-sugar epimerase